MATGPNPRRTLLEKLDQLPPERVAEVEDFVDFLSVRERDQAFAEFLTVAEEVAKAGVKPLTAEEIDAEIKTYRAERRAARS